ncbi:MAG: PorT family protein [Bacteroidetes bacterium]|nr:PorT family protein [Bacteroidota bacterium]
MNRSNTKINKIVKLALAVLLAITIGNQMTAQKNIHFGLKVVPGVYWLSSTEDSTKNDGTRFGFGYGAMLEFGLTDNYYLVTGVDMVAAGAKSITDIKAGTLTGTSASNFNIQYLQIPLFLKMKTKEIGMIKYFGQFGLGTGFALSVKNSWTTTIGTTVTTGSDTKKDNIFPLRESLLIGLGLEFNIAGSTSIVAGATFDNGFTPLLKKEDSNGKELPSLKSKGVTFTVGVLF